MYVYIDSSLLLLHSITYLSQRNIFQYLHLQELIRSWKSGEELMDGICGPRLTGWGTSETPAGQKFTSMDPAESHLWQRVMSSGYCAQGTSFPPRAP
jgi:hypothetical protein